MMVNVRDFIKVDNAHAYINPPCRECNTIHDDDYVQPYGESWVTYNGTGSENPYHSIFHGNEQDADAFFWLAGQIKHNQIL